MRADNSGPDAGRNAGLEANRAFYDRLWSGARLIGPGRFNTWPLVQALAAEGGLRLELGAGLRPRLPLAGTVFADISVPGLRPLRAAGGVAVAARADALPFGAGRFGLLCAMDILEHVAEDRAALAELGRVAAPGAALLLSVPLHMAAWSGFDVVVGHQRRYEAAVLPGLLAAAGFRVEAAAASGMLPRSGRVQRLGLWFLRRQFRRAMWWYNRVLMPLGLRRAAPLVLGPAEGDWRRHAGVLLLCRRV